MGDGPHLIDSSSSARMISLAASSSSSYCEFLALRSSSMSFIRPFSRPKVLMCCWSSRRTSTSLSFSSLRGIGRGKHTVGGGARAEATRGEMGQPNARHARHFLRSAGR